MPYRPLASGCNNYCVYHLCAEKYKLITICICIAPTVFLRNINPWSVIMDYARKIWDSIKQQLNLYGTIWSSHLMQNSLQPPYYNPCSTATSLLYKVLVLKNILDLMQDLNHLYANSNSSKLTKNELVMQGQKYLPLH